MRSLSSGLAVGLAALGLAACGSSSSSSNSSTTTTTSRATPATKPTGGRSAAEVAACKQIRLDFNRLAALGASTQNVAANDRADRVTAARYRAIATSSGITAQTHSALLSVASSLDTLASLPANTQPSSPQAQGALQHLKTSLTQLSQSCA